MKRVLAALALAVVAAAPAAAQWAGMPVWNNPKGGTGVTISGDYASNNDDAGGGSAFGARASLGLANLTLSAGVASWDADYATEKVTSFAGTAAFRVIGGSLLPVALNLVFGVGRVGEVNLSPTITDPALTTITGSAGLSTSVPTPGVSIEPYLSLGIRSRNQSGSSDSNFGWTIGANLAFGLLGLHLAYDRESFGGGVTAGIFGIGAHVGLRAPIGM